MHLLDNFILKGRNAIVHHFSEGLIDQLMHRNEGPEQSNREHHTPLTASHVHHSLFIRVLLDPADGA